MKFNQYYLDCLSHASYLIGDETTGRAVVVDPQRDVSEYIADAKELGMTIELVIETHFHADFLSGHLELAAATGATIVYGRAADGRVEFPIEALGDGDHIGSREEMAISAALRADTLIYTIRIYDKSFGGGGGWGGLSRIPGIGGPGMGGPGRGGGPGGRGLGGRGPGGPDRGDGKKSLQTLSKRTGGAYFEVGKKDTLEKIYATIEEELRSQYSLGYTPDAGAQSGYRRIKVDVRRKGVVVQGREGYYAEERP